MFAGVSSSSCAQDISESESIVHSKASDSETDSTTSVDEMCASELLLFLL